MYIQRIGWQHILGVKTETAVTTYTIEERKPIFITFGPQRDESIHLEGDKKFAELDDSKGYHRFQEFCADYERRGKRGEEDALVEPRDKAKGRIARSLLYMKDEYGLDLLGMDEMLEGWHKAYPVSNAEVWRNEVIFTLQGTRNSWVDK